MCWEDGDRVQQKVEANIDVLSSVTCGGATNHDCQLLVQPLLRRRDVPLELLRSCINDRLERSTVSLEARLMNEQYVHARSQCMLKLCVKLSGARATRVGLRIQVAEKMESTGHLHRVACDAQLLASRSR